MPRIGKRRLQILRYQLGRQFPIQAQGIRQLHLAWSPAFGREQFRRSNQDTDAASPGGSHVQPVQAVQEFHAVGRILRRGGRHRIYDHRRLLSLELIHRPHPRTGQSLLYLEDLSVVRCDNQNILECQRPFNVVFVDPLRAFFQKSVNEIAYAARLPRQRNSDWRGE